MYVLDWNRGSSLLLDGARDERTITQLKDLSYSSQEYLIKQKSCSTKK